MKISIIAALFVLMVGVGWWWWVKDRPTILQKGPVVLQKASRCPIPLPKDAKNIYFAYYFDHPVYQAFVRFDIPFDEGVAYAEDVLRDHAKAMKWDFKMPKAQTIVGPRQYMFHPVPDLRTDWFDIENIRSGVTFGEINSWQPQIWVDKDRNLFYFCLTD